MPDGLFCWQLIFNLPSPGIKNRLKIRDKAKSLHSEAKVECGGVLSDLICKAHALNQGQGRWGHLYYTWEPWSIRVLDPPPQGSPKSLESVQLERPEGRGPASSRPSHVNYKAEQECSCSAYLSLSSRNCETLYKWKAPLNGPPSSHRQIWDSPLLSPTFCAAEHLVTVGCSLTAYPPCPHSVQRPLELLNSRLVTWIIGHISTYPLLCLCIWLSSAHTCVCVHT